MAELIRDLKTGVTEIALTYDMYQDSAIVFDKLFEVCPHVILAPNDPLAKQETVSLKQLVGRQMVLLDLPISPQYSEFEHLFAMYGLTPTIRHRLKNFELVRSMVGAGLGYYSFGRLPILTERTYDGSTLVRRSIEEDVPKSKLCLAYVNHSVPVQVIEIFADACREAFHTEHGLLLSCA